MDVALQQNPEHPTKIEEEEEEERKEEMGVTIAVCSVKSEREPVMADSTTVQSESPLVTSTHHQQGPGFHKIQILKNPVETKCCRLGPIKCVKMFSLQVSCSFGAV